MFLRIQNCENDIFVNRGRTTLLQGMVNNLAQVLQIKASKY